MPVVKRASGYSWGRSGVVVATRRKAEQIGRAIMAMRSTKRKTKRRGGK
jgi:hypothetical protein